MNRNIIIFSLLIAAGCSSDPRSKAGEDGPPNIILIMADDLGFSDIGCYGSEINTPNIDYLATNGIRFSHFYNTSRCCPTRAALLTGLYNHQAGIGSMTRDQHGPGYRGYLTQNTVTLAEVLKDAGYHTAMAGKWHVSNTVVQENEQDQLDWLNHKTSHPLFSPVEQYPTNRGFEKFYGTIWGVVDHFDPFSLVNGTEAVREVPEDYYHTDAINDTAVAYIRDFADQDKPFFIYVAHNAPHWPVQAPPEDIHRYSDTYKVGWKTIRDKRYNKLVSEGLIDPATHRLAPGASEDAAWLNNPDKEWDARAMAVHAAMIDRMDQGIGRIINALRETGELENTLILFLSDNGASPEQCETFTPGFDRPGETRDGQKINYPADKKILPGPQTVYAGIGPHWASVANTPFRYWKIESYEGGVRTPLVAYWPGGINNRGGITHQPGHVMDFMATFIELAGASYPSEHNGHKISPLQGISLLPIFNGDTRTGHELMFNAHGRGKYARDGNWKIVASREDSTWSLYDLSRDACEWDNLADQYPERVQKMDSLWQKWAADNKVLPKPGN